MRLTILRIGMLGFLLCLVMSCQPGNYQAVSEASQKSSTKEEPTPQKQGAGDERALLEAVITAVNSKDVAKRRQPVHPAYLSCMDEGKDFYEDIFRNEFKSEIPQACSRAPIKNLAAGEPLPLGNDTQACSITLKVIAADEPLLLENYFSYPVRPTHWLQIEYGDKSKMIQAIQDNGKWFEVIPCAKPGTIKKFEEQKKGRGE